jgi:hypothetical protein
LTARRRTEEAERVAAEIVERARIESDQELAAAAEQSAWTQDALDKLRQAAALDAQQTVSAAHGQAASIIRASRARSGEVLQRATSRLRDRVEAAEQTTIALREEAAAELERSRAEAARVESEALERARVVVAEADASAKSLFERADRRLAEADSGARAVREQVAEELVRTQREAAQLRRGAREEASTMVSQARAEADGLRAAARTALTEARTEIAELTKRRKAIASELGNLSGVIEALAVDEGSNPTAPDPASAQPSNVQPSSAEPANAQPASVQRFPFDTAGAPDSSPPAGGPATIASPPLPVPPPGSDQSEPETKTDRNPFLLDEMMRSE